jgi:serine/threonine protein phosphatase 1
MPPRTIALGDVHGCSLALAALLKAIDPKPEDTIVTLGDYINRGIDTRGVLDQLLDLGSCCHLVPILGNHEATMLAALDNEIEFRFFLEMGGITTLDSYGDSGRLDLVPAAHWEFLRSCRRYCETDRHFFCHANYDPAVALANQNDTHLLWLSLRDSVPGPHCSGKIGVVGHTPQVSEEVLDLGHLLCLDTGCVSGGWLTALDVESGKVWQVDERGRRRPTALNAGS